MRTIKFRGKCAKDSRYAGEWVYGGLLQCEKSKDVLIVYPITDTCSCTYHVAPTTVGQYTGLTDRNGKEIYEGDIIDVHIPCNSIGKEEHRTRVVVWNEKYARFEFQDKRGNCIADSVGAKYNVVYYEVVGNVFDNPELLEEGGEQ